MFMVVESRDKSRRLVRRHKDGPLQMDEMRFAVGTLYPEAEYKIYSPLEQPPSYTAMLVVDVHLSPDKDGRGRCQDKPYVWLVCSNTPVEPEFTRKIETLCVCILKNRIHVSAETVIRKSDGSVDDNEWDIIDNEQAIRLLAEGMPVAVSAEVDDGRGRVETPLTVAR